MPKKLILIVEDDKPISVLVHSLLEKSGYEVSTASNGKEGVEKTKSEKPDLIIMDIRMPVMSGREAIRILKGNPETKDIPIICLTASVSPKSREELVRLGCTVHIGKPFKKDELLGEVKKYLSK